MMPGEGDGARRRGQYKKGTMQGEGDSARRGGQCKKKRMVPGEGDDVTEAALCSSCFQSRD